jgi:AcrR family transcriptional regulator
MNQLSSSESKSLPKTARGRRTREKILAAAEQIFGELGYERASIVEITQRASVAQGSFYTYFPNKQAAFTELVRSLSTGLRTAVAQAAGEETSRLAVERRSLIAFFTFILEHKSLYRIVRQAEFVDEELYRDYYRRIAQAYVRGLRKAVDAGELADLDVDTIAWSLMGMADFLGMRWVLWEDQLPPDSVIDTAMRFLHDGLAR